jgi:hypothetical protein
MPAKLDFRPHRTGTTMLAQKFRIEELTDGALNLTGCLIKMQLKTSLTGPVEHQWTSLPSGGLTITNAVNGQFEINKQIVSIPAFDYIYGIQIDFPNGDTDEFVSGLFPITEDNVD